MSSILRRVLALTLSRASSAAVCNGSFRSPTLQHCYEEILKLGIERDGCTENCIAFLSIPEYGVVRGTRQYRGFAIAPRQD